MNAKLDTAEKGNVVALNATLIGLFALFPALGYWAIGAAFAEGTVLGCVVVAINFFAMQKLIGRLVLDGKKQAWIFLAYMLKFAISVAILFIAVTRFRVDILGLMAGLSSLIVAVVVSTIYRGMTEK